MKRVYLSDGSFSYDVHSLVKAFYPEEEVKIILPEQGADFREEWDFRIVVSAEMQGSAKGSAGERAGQDDIFCGIILAESRARCEKQEIPQGITRPDVKNLLKKTLYHLLCGETGHTLPWGTLSGIRPVKVPMHQMLGGASEAEARTYFQKTYLADDSRSDLAAAIAKREMDVLTGREKLSSGKQAAGGLAEILNGYSLYVSIPFCPSICLYCSFPSGTIGTYKKHIEAYLAALERELSETALLMKGKTLLSVYIGGGTPTALMPEQLERVMDAIGRSFDCSSVLEYTVEAGRPDTITAEHLRNMRRHGVNRVSVNPQTMHQKTLDLIGRCHTVEDTERAYALAREAGFEDINTDLIIGLPGESVRDIETTLERVAALAPDALTVHSLAVKRSSRLHEKIEEYRDMTAPLSETTMDAIIAKEKQYGLMPYYLYRQKNIAGNLENIGFAKYGKAGLYNILMMEEMHTVIACGAGAISKIVYPGLSRIERAANVSDIASYLSRTDEMIGRKRSVLDAMEKDPAEMTPLCVDYDHD